MVDLVSAALKHIAETSPAGSLLASAIVALGLLLIVAAWALGVFDDRRNASQKTDFQGKLLEAIALLTDRESALLRENGELRDKVERVMMMVDLLRDQNRKVIEQNRELIDLLRGVIEGRVAPADIPISKLGTAS